MRADFAGTPSRAGAITGTLVERKRFDVVSPSAENQLENRVAGAAARVDEKVGAPPSVARTETRIDVTRAVRAAVESDEEIQMPADERETETRRGTRRRAPRMVVRPRNERVDPNAVPRAIRPSASVEKRPTRLVINGNAVIFVDVIGVIGVVFVSLDVNLNRVGVERRRERVFAQNNGSVGVCGVGVLGENVFFRKRFDEFFLERMLTEPMEPPGFVVGQRGDDVETTGANQVLNDRRFEQNRFKRLPNEGFRNDVRQVVALQVGVSLPSAGDGGADEVVEFEVVRNVGVGREALVDGDFRRFRLGAFFERVEVADEVRNVATRVMPDDEQERRSQVEDAVFDRRQIVGRDRAGLNRR